MAGAPGEFGQHVPEVKKGGRLAVAFRVLAKTARGQGDRATTAVTRNGSQV
jgi:hypothetical protein